jgi:hypothetical protein
VGLPWVRLDTQFPSNPKVLELVAEKRWRALVVYLSSLAYCGIHETDGYIPDTALPFVHATRADANTLVQAGLWDVEQGGWAVHDWHEMQFSSDENRRRRERAVKAAKKRWDNERKRRLHGV